jgi:hypothetical protein
LKNCFRVSPSGRQVQIVLGKYFIDYFAMHGKVINFLFLVNRSTYETTKVFVFIIYYLYRIL